MCVYIHISGICIFKGRETKQNKAGNTHNMREGIWESQVDQPEQPSKFNTHTCKANSICALGI